MKLLNKTTFYFLLPAVVMIIICAAIQFVLVNSQITERVDKQLVKEKRLILKQLKDIGDDNDFTLYKTLKSEIEIVEEVIPRLKEDTIYSSSYYDEEDEEEVLIRVLEFSSEIGDQIFKVKIRKPMEKTQSFIYGLVGANILLFALLIFLSLIINRYISKNIWKPFYDTLQKLQLFNISSPTLMNIQDSKIYEFNLLNNEIDLLIQKITRDYNNYKFFIENVSHELQTPIAVAKSKLELVIQSENIKEEEHALLSMMSLNLNKLSRLNQSLILLLKIENNLFSEKSTVLLNDLVKESISNFDDIIELQNIKLTLNIDHPLSVQCNELLAEILIDNLVKNSVKHNVENGFIDITTSQDKFAIKNSGLPLVTRPEFLFERFKKDSHASDSTGLGLSIVHQICKSSKFSVKYLYSDEKHTIEINF